MMGFSRVSAVRLAIIGFSAIVVGLACGSAANAEHGKKHRPVGGFSYSKSDAINTYGDNRSKFGGATSLRDPKLDRQTTSGPFDHGFFFDSAMGRNGGDSPYMN